MGLRPGLYIFPVAWANVREIPEGSRAREAERQTEA